MKNENCSCKAKKRFFDCFYIQDEREKERERNGEREGKREPDTSLHI